LILHDKSKKNMPIVSSFLKRYCFSSQQMLFLSSLKTI
jgi:hypothetical protein